MSIPERVRQRWLPKRVAGEVVAPSPRSQAWTLLLHNPLPTPGTVGRSPMVKGGQIRPALVDSAQNSPPETSYPLAKENHSLCLLSVLVPAHASSNHRTRKRGRAVSDGDCLSPRQKGVSAARPGAPSSMSSNLRTDRSPIEIARHTVHTRRNSLQRNAIRQQ